jgi:DNA-binding NarL/FixJ family response regulator
MSRGALGARPNRSGGRQLIRVAVVGNRAATRETIVRLVDAEPDLEVVATGTSAADALDLTAEARPAVVMLDLSEGPARPEEVTRAILEEGGRRTAVLALAGPGSEAETDRRAWEAIRAGAAGFCTQTDSPAELLRSIRVVAQGDAVVSPSVLRSLLDRLAPSGMGAFTSCSGREIEVLELVARGATNGEIAEQLAISETTVRTHVQHLRDKLCARNRIELVVLANRSGLGLA